MTRIYTSFEDEAASGKASGFFSTVALILSGFLALATFAAS